MDEIHSMWDWWTSVNSRFRPVIRVFVSSTFSDLKHERNALQDKVFPKLEQLCAQDGFQFQAIDLRWGVSSEAGLDHRTMRICFDELRRAQDISPEPNFLVLLGNRYGWRPLPEEISQVEFEKLALVATSSGENHAPIEGTHGKTAQQILREWYRWDENVVLPSAPETSPDLAPLNYILQPRTQDLGDRRDYTRRKDDLTKDTQDWIDVQQILWSIINAAFPAELLDRRFDHLDWEQYVADVNDRPHLKRAIPQISRFQASATEQEIWCGALSAPNAERHVLAFFRDLTNRDEYAPADVKDFFDLTEAGEFDAASAERQKALKEAIKRRLGDRATVPVPFSRLKHDNDKVVVDASEENIKNFCDDVRDRLRPIIERQIEEYWHESAPASPERAARGLKIEQDEHERFGRERGGAKLFVGRQTELRAIRDYLQNDSPWPLMVYGASGCGKTALLARAAEEIQESEVSGQKAEVILRFIGVTPRSSDIRSLLGSLCQELRLRHPRELPTETKALSEELQEHFRSATPEQPLFLFLDALDQLSDADNGRLLNWLPRGQLPGHVKLVVSCLSDRAKDDQAGQPFAELTRRHLPAQNIINLDALSEDEAGTLLFDRWLPEAGRTVSRNQRERIWQRLESKDCRQPIYLKLLFEEARTLRSYDAAHELGESVPAILGQLIERLSRPANHGRLLVERLLGYLAASRHGLAENEILEVLFADAEYKAALDQATEQTHHELPASATRIPIAIWSRLRFDLAPYLTERAAPGANVLTFYHRQVAEWVQEHFVKASDHSWQPHRRLADYFRSHADPERNQTWKGNSPRPFLELPFHIGHAEIWSELVAVLEDIFFLEAKNSHGLAFALVGDFTTALRQLPRDHSQYRILNLLEEALRRDINFIARHARDYPQALFQCLWNSCWWFDCQLSERHYEMPNTGWSNTDPPWNRSGGKLCQLMERWRAEREAHIPGFFWLRSLRPPPTELSCGFNGVLQGHVDQVLSMGVSRDGSRIATVSMNHETSIWTVHLWDAKTHQHLGTIENSTEPVDGAFSSVARVALSPDGSKVAVGCSKVSLYDFALCTVIGSLADCGTKVCSLAYSHDGRWIATGSEDGTARLWDTRTLELVRTFGRHAAVVDLVAFSPDGRCLATAGSRAIGIWEIDTGSSLNVIEEFDEIKALTFSPDGTRIAYGRDDGCVKICDTFTDKVPVRIQAHRRPIRGVAFVNGAHAVVTAAFEDLVNIWDAREGNLLESFSCGTEGATSLAVLPDGETIVAGSAAGPLWIWTKTGFGHGAELRGSGKAKGMWQSPNGQRLVSSMADGSIIFWDAQSALLLRSIKAGGSPYRFLGFSANGERFATLHRGRVEIWNTAAVKEVAWFELSQDEHDCVSFSPKGLALATWRKAGGNRKESWSVISAWTGPLIPLVDFKAHSDIIRGVTILDDEHTLVSASADGLVCLWSGTNGQIHFRWDLGHDIEKIAVSPGSRFSVCIGFYGTSVTVFDLVKGTRLPELEGLQLPCANVKFESEGEQMATIPRTNSTFLAGKSDVNEPNEIQIWNLRNGKCLRTESVSADDFSLSYFMSQGSTATSESIFTKAGSGKPVGWFPVALSAMPGDQGRRWYGHAVRGGTTDERNLFVLTLESTDAD